MSEDRDQVDHQWLQQFGKACRAARQRQHLSQEQLARQVGVHRVTLLKMELGRRDPPATEAARIARVLGMSIPEWPGQPDLQDALECAMQEIDTLRSALTSARESLRRTAQDEDASP